MPPLLARIVITWAVILVLVLAAQAALAPLVAGWPSIAATAVTMALVVPVAVGWALPAAFRLYVAARASIGGRR